MPATVAEVPAPEPAPAPVPEPPPPPVPEPAAVPRPAAAPQPDPAPESPPQRRLPRTSPTVPRTPVDPAWATWFEGKQLHADWTSHNFPVWATVLKPFLDRPDVNILEIGAYEGRSAIFFLNYLPDSHIVCIDTVLAPDRSGDPEAQAVANRLRSNLGPFGNRVTLRTLPSLITLAELTLVGMRFDIAFIDGDHRRDSVALDSLAVWPLMKPGGIVIWDDYDWGHERPEDQRPQGAIDWFLDTHPDATVIHAGFQVIARKDVPA